MDSTGVMKDSTGVDFFPTCQRLRPQRVKTLFVTIALLTFADLIAEQCTASGSYLPVKIN